ncbi:MAG: glycosyltransferase family 9 protein [Gammaproteobacteria bacterium]|nr:glycosyltransferase family 9 protein [Gammaproteobacteria bacterium]MBI5616329.1 glycosyltransferase family 9 protein [Gammaproteobacteria bacterium]
MNPPRALFVTLSNIGDLVMTTPALAALHAAYPDHVFDIVADRRSSALLLACPFLGELHHRDKAAGAPGMLKLAHTLRRHRYEFAVDLRTDFLPWLVRARRRCARWQCKGRGTHSVEQHFAVAQRILPPDTAIPMPAVWYAEAEQRAADEALEGLHGSRWIALGPGANWRGKIWPLAHFIRLSALLASEFDAVVLLGGPGDASLAAAFASTCTLPCRDLCGRTSLPAAAAVLARCTAFVGNDSGLGHMAAAVGTPTVTLFGPGDPERYRPWGPQAMVALAPELDLERLDPVHVAQDVRAHLAALPPSA